MGGDFPAGFGTPVIAFEFAQSAQEVQSALGINLQEASQRVADMQTGTALDFPFILAYGIFMMSFLGAARHQTGKGFYGIFIGLAFLAAISDSIENVFALKILSNIETAPGVEWMTIFVQAKFVGLGLCGLAAGHFLISQPRSIRKLEGFFCVMGGVLTLFALTNPSVFGTFLGFGVTISWIAMLAYSATQSFKRIAAEKV